MSQFYSELERENDTYALPDCQVFYRTRTENKEYEFLDPDGKTMPNGWYYWYCFPGCMPDSDPWGPYATKEDAIADARENAED